MLSRREREFLTNPEKFTGSYARWLRYSIKRKIRKTMQDLELISRTWPQALENSLTPLVNVREYPNMRKLIFREKASEKEVWGNLFPNAGPGGLEPPTSGVQNRHSSQLSYGPIIWLCLSLQYFTLFSIQCKLDNMFYKFSKRYP